MEDDTAVLVLSAPVAGSSSDQDSMIYRYGDTDSGLGRATPPRRAPSPGITSGRHLTSPSGSEPFLYFLVFLLFPLVKFVLFIPVGVTVSFKTTLKNF